jgi:hypothetical protein
MEEDRCVRLLRSCPLFAAVPEGDLRRLSGSVSVRRYRRGHATPSSHWPRRRRR